MRHRITQIMAAALLTVGGSAYPIIAAQPADPCAAPRVTTEAPGDGAKQDASPDTTDHNLSQRLATCGSVLEPPPVGDPDIVEPAPRVGDPMNIHPRTPDEIRPPVK